MASLYYRVLLQNDPTDTNWKVGYTLLWTWVASQNVAILGYLGWYSTYRQVEMWAGVTASCMPAVKQFFSRYRPSVPHSITLMPSLLSFRRSTKESVPDAERGFRQWGYKSNAETESTTRIGHGSANSEIEKVNSRSTFSQKPQPCCLQPRCVCQDIDPVLKSSDGK